MKLLQNKKIAYLTAIFCTLLWGTAFPFIKVGYSAFKIVDIPYNLSLTEDDIMDYLYEQLDVQCDDVDYEVLEED